LPRGLPGTYIKRAQRELGKGASWSSVFKRAWELYKGSRLHEIVSGNRNKKIYKGRSKRKSRRRISLPRRRKSRRRRKTTIPIAAVSGAIAGLFVAPPGGTAPVKAAMDGNFELAFNDLIRNYTGYNIGHGYFNIFEAKGLHAAIIGYIAHKIASILGINRALGRAKIPLIRI